MRTGGRNIEGLSWIARSLLLSLALAAVRPCDASAQSAIEHHAWQDGRSFEPMSRTAQAITGPITLSGNPDFALRGSRMKITFGNGSTVELRSEGAAWRVWDLTDTRKETAEVFRLDRDPGPLENGNTLCGNPQSEPARYLVFFEDYGMVGDHFLSMAAFSSKKPPHDINSPGLCGTFSFYID